MRATIKHRTTYSQSPVLIVSESNGEKYQPDVIRLALDNKGDIYRLLAYNEQPVKCEPFEVDLTEKTVALVENWKKYRKYSSPCDLHKLATIQKYNLTLGYGSIANNPLHSLDINLYYPASAALEQYNRAESYSKELSKAFSGLKSLKDQVTVLQAKLKVPAKMAEMGCNEKQALAYVLGGKRYESELKQLFEKKIIHPNGYSGRGKYTSKGSDHAAAIANILSIAHIKHTTGNDAPKGGFSGNFIKIK